MVYALNVVLDSQGRFNPGECCGVEADADLTHLPTQDCPTSKTAQILPR
jgi:hypothetical protein